MDPGVNSKLQERTKALQQDNVPLFLIKSIKTAYLEWHREIQDKDTTVVPLAFQFSKRNKNKYLHTWYYF